MKRFALFALLMLAGIVAAGETTPSRPDPYFDNSGREDVLSGGAR